MTALEHGIIDCHGLQIVTSLPWADADWGFLVCSSGDGTLYGLTGSTRGVRVNDSRIGIPLETKDPRLGLARLALGCGLSILELTRLELGEKLLVSGVNALALSVLAAGHVQHARLACIDPNLSSQSPYRAAIERLVDKVIAFDDIEPFDEQLAAFVTGTLGDTAFVDTAGVPGPVQAMVGQLGRFGVLALAQENADTTVVLKMREMHHLKSAHFAYRIWPTYLEGALGRLASCRRAANLLANGRVDASLFEAIPANAPMP